MVTEESESQGTSTSIHKILEMSATAAIGYQRDDGSFPPGQNGVYNERETPVRTTSLWLTTLSKVYRITQENKFADAAHRAADYLLTEEARPYGYTFHSRYTDNKDRCDGLVGQAPPIRGMAYAGKTFDRPELLETARDVALLHPFNEEIGLWERVEIDGTSLSIDRTLNHQILFAASLSYMAENYDKIKDLSVKFAEKLTSNINLRDDGIIRHYINPPLTKSIQTTVQKPRNWPLLVNNALSFLYSQLSSRRQKEIGYHPVNLMGIAQLKNNLVTAGVWSEVDEKIPVSAITTEDTLSLVAEYDGKYGAMTPSIDTALALTYLCNTDQSRIQSWVERDFQNKFNLSSGLLEEGTEDKWFQASAISYAVDLPDYPIQL